MIICVDFDDTIVVQDGRAYEDVDTPLQFVPNAKLGLLALRAAGHVLVLYSVRANRSLREDPSFDPMVRAAIKRMDLEAWPSAQLINEARYQQMLQFVDDQLSGIFAVVDDGIQGKPAADMYIDDKAVNFGEGLHGTDWGAIIGTYGDLEKVLCIKK